MNIRKKNALKRVASAVMSMWLSVNMIIPAVAGDTDDYSLSDQGIEFIKEKEGFRSEAYNYGDKWYIGYGTSCEKDEYPDGVTEEEAVEMLTEHLQTFEDYVENFAEKNDLVFEQHQFDALVSFTYTLGGYWLNGNSDLVNIIKGNKEATRDEIVDAFGIWCHVAGEPEEGLAVRRIQEAMMYMDGDYDSKKDEDYSYLIFECNGGDTPRDILFYKTGEVYGYLPKATLSGHTFAGWKTKSGTMLTIEHTIQQSRTVYAQWVDSDYSHSFGDVTSDKWFYSYIMDLSEEGVIAGYPDGNYGPYDMTTAAAAVTLLMRAVGFEEQGVADDHWAGGFINLAHEKGYLDKDRLGDYDGKITRIEIASIAARALELELTDSESPFVDTENRYAVALYEAGIMEGSVTDKGREFDPQSDITRGEMAAVIWRIRQLNEEAHAEHIIYKDYVLDVHKSVPKSKLKADAFYTEDGFKRYDDGKRVGVLGIDVSDYQGEIDWEAVKNDGIEYAFIRVGGRGYGTGALYDDDLFEQNMQGAIDAGLDVGVYFFSQAISADEAEEEAEYVLDKIADYDFTGPVVFDWEIIGTTSARTYGLSTKTLCAAANRFCETVEDAGYQPMVYFNTQVGYLKYDLSQIVQYPFWFAQYGVSAPTFYYDFDIWQYTDSGTVDGIDEPVDMNLYFVDK